MLEDYLSMAAILTPALRNEDGSAQMDNRTAIQYDAERSIACRRRDMHREIITADKQVIQASTIYYVLVEVQIDDLLDGKRVQDVFVWRDLDGDVVGYKAVV